ncbi:hypothetical protein FHW88_000416 [Mucilaginibacter sp. SG538B]|uniref:hypothetical protein n=1 Tax=Mucilaginibacter sp. SG538B TaxID=2587021 RepID=UPI00159EAF0E|nr:hypothetical protein [Mucilaginibacter sp. SG538B]NVM62140.1 hypothetical protein [Mucilaginibacter sp. SG538B]
MNRLSGNFSQLRDGLISWRRMGHGLWPIRYWPDSVIENYVSTLQDCITIRPRYSVVLFVQNGRDSNHSNIENIINELYFLNIAW